MLIEFLLKDEKRISQIGIKALATAKAAGVPAYYIDAAVGEGIVKLMPDGTIHLIDPDKDDDVILRTIKPGR